MTNYINLTILGRIVHLRGPIKKMGMFLLEWIILIFGVLSFIGLYESIYEYSEGLFDLSWMEIILIGSIVTLFKWNYTRCSVNGFNFWETMRRPFIAVGWLNLCIFIIGILWLFIDKTSFREQLENIINLSLQGQLFLFGSVMLSLVLGTPKIFNSPWVRATNKRKKPV